MPNVPETGEGKAFIQPTLPEVPPEGQLSGSTGAAASLVYLYKSDEATSTISLVSTNSEISFPLYPSVALYKQATGEAITAASVEATWERTEIVPGLPGLKITFGKLTVAPLKKGEVIAICVTG